MNKYPKWATVAVKAAERHEERRLNNAARNMNLALKVLGIESSVTDDSPVNLDDFVFTVESNGHIIELHVLDRVTNDFFEQDIDSMDNSQFEAIKISFGKWILNVMEERAAKETP